MITFTRQYLLTALILIPANMIAATVSAADESRPDLFARLDTNGDGLLRADELARDQARLFARLLRTADENGDEALSVDEFAAGLKPERVEKPIEEKLPSRLPGADAAQVLLLKMDVDGNSQIEKDEVPDELLPAFDEMVDRIDRNDDGIMQRDELVRGGPRLSRLAQRMMRRLDIDVAAELARLQRDQGPAASRFDAAPNPARMLGDRNLARQLFVRLDGNGDGQLELAEVPEPIQERFRRLFRLADRDSDQRLSEREFLAAAERVARFEQVAEMRDSSEKSTKKSSQLPSHERVGRMLVEWMVARMDRNGDGQISRDESQGMLSRRFDGIDTDGDDLLDAEELARVAQRIAERLPQEGSSRPSSREGLSDDAP